jgi:hypothetical protein
MRRADKWLDQLAWSQFASLYFALMALIFALAQYLAAWSKGGVADNDFGLTRTGQLFMPRLAMAAGIFTTGQVLARAWRHRRASTPGRPVPRADRPL